MNKDFNQIILVGPCNSKYSKSTGGAVVLFEQLIISLDKMNINYIVIDTNKNNYKSKIGALVYIIKNLIKHSKSDSILFFNSSNDYLYISLILPFLTYKKFILRKFGGEFNDSYYGKRGFIESLLCKYAINKYDLIYLETKKLVKNATIFCPYIKYFPNVRTINSYKVKTKPFTKKLVYIGRIYKEKGINQILDNSEQLAKLNYTIDIYGPIIEPIYREKFNKNEFINYKGIIDSNEILVFLKDYDLLLFPSEDEGEGYPGIIIEAMSQGLPIIASSVGGVSEMVTNKENGYTYSLSSKVTLLDTILKVSDSNYLNLSSAAVESAKKYDSDIVTKKIIKELL